MRRPNLPALDELTHITRSSSALHRRPVRRRLLGSGVVLAALVGMLFITGVAGAALAKVGIGGSGQPDPSQYTTPMQIVNGVPTFPTPTLPAWRSGPTPPAVPIPNSRTPAPGATPEARPSATTAGDAAPTAGGGSGTPLPTTCTGSAQGASWAFSTCPPVHGQPLRLSIVARAYPNAATNIVISFGTCSGCTLVLTPQQGYHLDATGHELVTVTVPSVAAHSGAPVGGMINIASGPSLTISAAPVR
jgi:hypothetical protein